MLKSKYFTYLCLVFFIQGCATAKRHSDSPSGKKQSAKHAANSVSTKEAEEKLIRQTDEDYRAKLYEKVLKETRTFIQVYPESQKLAYVYNYRALAYIGQKQNQFALFNLKKALERIQDTREGRELEPMIYYNMAFVYFELGQIDQTIQHLQKVELSSIEQEHRAKFFILRAKTTQHRLDYFHAAQDVFLAVEQIQKPVTGSILSPYVKLLDSYLEKIEQINLLEKLLDEFGGSPAADRLYFKIGQFYFANNGRPQSKSHFEKIVDRYPDSRYHAEAQDYLRKLSSQEIVNPRRIGVMLTLSGKFGRFGYNALKGIELALNIFESTREKAKDPDPLVLVVMDDQGDPDRALFVLDELFYKHHVVGVIGPLVSKLAEPVGKRAQELGLPLVALTQKEAIGGDYVFNAALTPAMQVHQLFEYLSGTLNIKNYVLMAPENKFGEEYTRAFWEELQAYGGALRGAEIYPSEETDFRTYVDRVVGLAHHGARAKEVAELETLKTTAPQKMTQKKLDQMFALKPIIDFQAVFIPDEPRMLGQILPTFAYRDAENILFVGVNTWNSQELLARAGHYVEGAIFVDGFYADSSAASSKRFIEEFRENFSSEPSLVEAMSYDAANIVATLLNRDKVKSRNELKDKIASLSDFQGVTGKISYRSGRLTKRLNLLTVKNGKIVEVVF